MNKEETEATKEAARQVSRAYSGILPINISEALKNKWTIKNCHIRVYIEGDSMGLMTIQEMKNHIKEKSPIIVSPRGGITMVQITSPDGKIVLSGIKFCSMLDTFTYKKGVKGAFFAALARKPVKIPRDYRGLETDIFNIFKDSMKPRDPKPTDEAK